MQGAIGGWFRIACLALWGTLASGALEAQAQDGPKRVVVLDFEGPGSASVRGYVIKALKEQSDIEIVPVREVEDAATRLELSVDEPESYVRLASELQLSAFVGGSLERKGGDFRATIWVRDGSTGQELHSEPWARKKKPQLKTIQSNFWAVMGPHISASSPPQKEEAKPEPVAAPAFSTDDFDKTPEPEISEPSTPSQRPALILSIGPRLLNRTLQFDNDQLGNLRSYETKAAFELAFGAQWYPGAHFRDDWLSNVGLDVDGDYAIGLKSKEAGRTLATTAYELGAGLIFRLPLDMFEPRLRLGYVRQVFDVDTAPTVFLPSMTYSSARLGLGTAVKVVDAFSLDVNLGYLFVLDAGDLTSDKYFPNASVGSFEAGAGALLRITGPYSVRAGIDWRRYFFDLKPDAAKTQPGGQKLADGANDDYLRVTVSFVYMLGQSGQ